MVKGKSIYFTAEQIEYLRLVTDPINVQEDEERDELRAQIFKKVSKMNG